MSELSEKFLNLEITDHIFEDIKYFISGDVHEKVSNGSTSASAIHHTNAKNIYIFVDIFEK